MPIKIPDALPAAKVLEFENIFVMPEDRACAQDIRPLKILILNLMPKKIDTETQLLRLLSNTPIQVDIELLQTATHQSKNTPSSHLLTFYKTFNQIRDRRFDGMIVTGAPVEHLEFEQVDYWEELCEIFEWAKTNVYCCLHICWGAQAALYYYYGIKKYPLGQKMFGVFPHKCLDNSHPIIRGFDELFYVPHSRHTEVRREDILKHDQLEIIAESEISGPHIIASRDSRRFFATGHSEYDRETLAQEYFRDRDKGLPIHIPFNYFPGDDPSRHPYFTWRAHANLFFSNWLNYFVYQETPFDLSKLDGGN